MKLVRNQGLRVRDRDQIATSVGSSAPTRLVRARDEKEMPPHGNAPKWQSIGHLRRILVDQSSRTGNPSDSSEQILSDIGSIPPGASAEHGAAIHGVDAGAPGQRVVARQPYQRVVASGADKDIIAVYAIQDIGVGVKNRDLL
jgi:hypothetical protein